MRDILEDLQSRSNDVLVFLGGTLPDLINEILWDGVLDIDASDIDKLKWSLDDLSVRILNEDILNQLILDHPLWEILEVEEPGVSDVVLLQHILGVSIALVDFLENFLEVSHASDFLVEIGAH